MIDEELKREFIRAPLKSSIIYADGENVFRAKVINISEGGILIEQLPCMPDKKDIFFLLAIPEYPDFRSMDLKKLEQYRMAESDFYKKIIRLRGEIVRSFEGMSKVEQVFVKEIGCRFIDVPDLSRKIIRDYIANVSKVIEVVLGLFKSFDDDHDYIHPIRMILAALGYNIDKEIGHLRQKVMHDYQNLR